MRIFGVRRIYFTKQHFFQTLEALKTPQLKPDKDVFIFHRRTCLSVVSDALKKKKEEERNKPEEEKNNKKNKKGGGGGGRGGLPRKFGYVLYCYIKLSNY